MPPEQHAVLVFLGHAEVREDQCEDEDVVDRQALLDQVAGQVLASCLRTHPQEDDSAERQPERDPEDAEPRGFPERDIVRFAMEDEQVQGEQEHDEAEESDPGPDADVHP